MASSTSSAETGNRKRVVVCGGGVIGACTAYFLAEKGGTSAHVTLVERCSLACAASGKAGGFLALDWCSGALDVLARASFQLHQSLAAVLDGPRSYGYRRLTTLSLPLLPPNSSPSPSRPSDLPPWIDGPTVRAPRTIGTVETTAQVHPQMFTWTLVRAAEKHGLEVVIGEVEKVEVADGKATGVALKDGRIIEADAVVLALGPWSSRSPLITSLFSVSGLKAHSIVLKPKEPDAITPHALFLSYQPAPGAKTLDPEVYPRPTGEVYVCGMSQEVEVPEDPAHIVGDPSSILMLHKIAGAVSSHLKDGEAEVVTEQACFLPCSEDGLPVIGEIPGVAGCYVGTGHSCWGILNGPATGASLAELILDGKSTTVDLSAFNPERFLRRRGRLQKSR